MASSNYWFPVSRQDRQSITEISLCLRLVKENRELRVLSKKKRKRMRLYRLLANKPPFYVCLLQYMWTVNLKNPYVWFKHLLPIKLGEKPMYGCLGEKEYIT